MTDKTDPEPHPDETGNLARSAARLGAVQALYQMEITGASAADVIEEFSAHHLGQILDEDQLREADPAFFADLVRGVVYRQVEIDRAINAMLAKGWRMERLDSIVRALLRAAVYELLGRGDVPARVAINEYMDVVHAFLDKEQASFVNGILDGIARKGRGSELTEKP